MAKNRRVLDLAHDYISAKDIMGMYDVSLQTVNNWRTRNGLPFVKVILSDKKNIIRFNKEEVKAWAKEHQKTPVRKELR